MVRITMALFFILKLMFFLFRSSLDVSLYPCVQHEKNFLQLSSLWRLFSKFSFLFVCNQLVFEIFIIPLFAVQQPQ